MVRSPLRRMTSSSSDSSNRHDSRTSSVERLKTTWVDGTYLTLKFAATTDDLHQTAQPDFISPRLADFLDRVKQHRLVDNFDADTISPFVDTAWLGIRISRNLRRPSYTLRFRRITHLLSMIPSGGCRAHRPIRQRGSQLREDLRTDSSALERSIGAHRLDLTVRCSTSFSAPQPINASPSQAVTKVMSVASSAAVSKACTLPGGEFSCIASRCNWSRARTCGWARLPSERTVRVGMAAVWRTLGAVVIPLCAQFGQPGY